MNVKKTSKIKILILGYSHIARKAVIASIQKNLYVTLAGIASQSNYQSIPSEYDSFNSYDDAIRNSDCDVVYISLHNNAHYKWIINSLKYNKHVICDKPAVLNSKQALECYKIAGNKLMIFESLPYRHHFQHKILKEYIDQQRYPLQKITAHFGFPGFAKNNFHNIAKLGGGCLYDIGPYMISTGQLYFNKNAASIYCNAYTPQGWDVPTSASIMIQYGKNQILQGQFGFQLEYRNNINLWGRNFYYTIDRAFSAPPDYYSSIIYRSKDKIKKIPVPLSDSFSEMFTFFHDILHDKIKRNSINKKILEQSIQMDAMIKSATTQKFETVKYRV